MQPTWIFGYGSLIFRPDYDARERRTATLRGYARRFWQASPDHRGTPEAHGLVVTLVPSTTLTPAEAALGTDTVGVASLVDVDDALMATLDHREKAGYQRLLLPLDLDDGRTVDGLVYFADAENPHFRGPLDTDTIAAHVASSRGPSGDNSDYVLRLDVALRDLGVDDPHVAAIAAALRR